MVFTDKSIDLGKIKNTTTDPEVLDFIKGIESEPENIFDLASAANVLPFLEDEEGELIERVAEKENISPDEFESFVSDMDELKNIWSDFQDAKSTLQLMEVDAEIHGSEIPEAREQLESHSQSFKEKLEFVKKQYETILKNKD